MCHRRIILNSNNDINLDHCDVLIGMIVHNWCFSSTFSMSFWAVIAYTESEALVKAVWWVSINYCKWKFTFRPSGDASVLSATKKMLDDASVCGFFQTKLLYLAFQSACTAKSSLVHWITEGEAILFNILFCAVSSSSMNGLGGKSGQFRTTAFARSSSPDSTFKNMI